MSDEVLSFIIDLITEHQLQQVLELGSCWGYSALCIASETKVEIISLERDLERHTQARYHVKTMNFQERIEMVYDDALVYQPNQSFDLIVIDAVKAQNQAFVDRYYPYLNIGGFMVIDNAGFHGQVHSTRQVPKSIKAMITSLREFSETIQEDSRFRYQEFNIGDGLIVLEKIV